MSFPCVIHTGGVYCMVYFHAEKVGIKRMVSLNIKIGLCMSFELSGIRPSVIRTFVRGSRIITSGRGTAVHPN